MNSLYFDIVSGISGDMTLAALLNFNKDLIKELNFELSNLLKGNVELSLEKQKINGIATQHLKIDVQNHKKPHRNLKSISNMLQNSNLSENTIKDATGIFEIIADAEAKSHNQPAEKVHFHEVGAIDSIIDITGIAFCINKLDLKRIISSPVTIGNGLIKTEHGILPVPAPATIEILKNIPVKRIDVNDEITTPTGAAVIKYYAELFTNEFSGKSREISMSCGTKRFDTHPNMLRIFKFEENNFIPQKAVVIETNIDDDTGENLGFLSGLLMKKGALDVSFTSVLMKKNRPAYKLTAIVTPESSKNIINEILKNSSASGVRFYNVDRVVMNREIKKIKINGIPVGIKIFKLNDIVKHAPEWDDVINYAKIKEIPPSKAFKVLIAEINSEENQ